MPTNEMMQREVDLVATIQKTLPDFVKACADSDAAVVILHQDAFAADYQQGEYTLLGMAIKYAGLCGKDVQVVVKNRETVEAQTSTQ